MTIYNINVKKKEKIQFLYLQAGMPFRITNEHNLEQLNFNR